MNGDRATELEEFILAETPRLLVLARAMTRNDHDAWDLTQESLARVAERWDSGKVHTPAAYVRTVMTRLNIDRIRRFRREVLAPETPEVAPHSDHAGGEGQWLLGVLPLLTPKQRTALALRFVEDLSVAQIAERMRCSEGTVKSHLSRGLERLRDQNPNDLREEISR